MLHPSSHDDSECLVMTLPNDHPWPIGTKVQWDDTGYATGGTGTIIQHVKLDPFRCWVKLDNMRFNLPTRIPNDAIYCADLRRARPAPSTIRGVW